MDEYGSAWFRYSLAGGKSQPDSVTIVNNSAATKRIAVYPVDATATRSGALAMRNQSEPRLGIGAWIKLGADSLTLLPFEHRNLPFTLTIPPSTPVGDQVGGIIIQEESPSSTVTKQGVHLQVVSRLGVRVYETVPGTPHLRLSIKNFLARSSSRMRFTLTLENTGNMTIRPQGTVGLTGIFGIGHEEMALPPITLLPQRTAVIELTSPHEHLVANAGRAKLNLTYGSARSTQTIAYRWLNLAAIAIIIMVLSICVGVIIKFQTVFISLRYSNNKRGDN